VGELLSTLDAEDRFEHLQVQAQISLLRSQIVEAMDGLHAESADRRSVPPTSPFIDERANLPAEVQCQSAEIRLQDTSSTWDISAPTVHARASALYGCLLRSMGSRSLWAFARWYEAVRALGARRLLQLTHDVLSDHKRELDDARKRGGHMRVIALIVLTRTRALHSAFLSWAHAPPAWAAEAGIHRGTSIAAVHDLRRKIEQLSAHLAHAPGGKEGNEEWQEVCEEVSGMVLSLEHERAALALERKTEQNARAALMAKIARLEAQSRHGSTSSIDRDVDDSFDQDQDIGAAAIVRAAQTAAAAASHAAFLAERENVMLRDELQKARGAVHMRFHSGGCGEYADAAMGPYEDGNAVGFETPGWPAWRSAAQAIRENEHSAGVVQAQCGAAVGRFALGEAPLSRCSAFQHASNCVLSSAATALTPHVLGDSFRGTARAGGLDPAAVNRSRPTAGSDPASLGRSCAATRFDPASLSRSRPRTSGAGMPRGPVALHARLNRDSVQARLNRDLGLAPGEGLGRLNWDLVQAPGEGLGVASGLDPWQIYTTKHPTAFGGLGARAGQRVWL
jgi:hypothetical protein